VCKIFEALASRRPRQWTLPTHPLLAISRIRVPPDFPWTSAPLDQKKVVTSELTGTPISIPVGISPVPSASSEQISGGLHTLLYANGIHNIAQL